MTKTCLVFQAGLRLDFGCYECARCRKAYIVNDQWARCSPEFCHDCLRHLEQQYALISDPPTLQ